MIRKILFVTILLLAVVVFADDRTEEFWKAAKGGDVEKVKALLAEGVDVNARNPYGATAMSFAADKGQLEVIKVLIEHGADINTKDSFYGATPLNWAADNKHLDVVRLLLQKGATGAADALGSGIYNKDMELMIAVLEET